MVRCLSLAALGPARGKERRLERGQTRMETIQNSLSVQVSWGREIMSENHC